MFVLNLYSFFLKYSGGIIITSDRPQSIHAETMHQSMSYAAQVNKPPHSPTSFSLSTTNASEFSEMQNPKIESPFKDHEQKVTNYLVIKYFEMCSLLSIRFKLHSTNNDI
jgi:hypothetical protein